MARNLTVGPQPQQLPLGNRGGSVVNLSATESLLVSEVEDMEASQTVTLPPESWVGWEAGVPCWAQSASGSDIAVWTTGAYGLNVAGASGGSGVSSFNNRTGTVMPASGDYTAAMVGAIPLPASPTNGDTIQWNGTAWVAVVPSSNATELQGVAVSVTAPTSLQVLQYNGTDWVPVTLVIPAAATTVTGPDAFGAPSVVGTGTTYARQDHDHGLPSAPSVPAAASTVTGPDTFGEAAAVGTGTEYARDDHNHGLPSAPAVPAAATTVTGPDAFGAPSVVGTGTTYARDDHDHGLPAAPADIPLSTVTTAGDLIQGTGAGAVARLALGTLHYVLGAAAGAAAWVASATSTLTTTGDMLIATAANTLGRVGIGTVGQVWTVLATGLPGWATPSGGGFAAHGSFPPAAYVNGAQTFITLTAPDDGFPHVLLGSLHQNITAATNGGGNTFNYTSAGVVTTTPVLGPSQPVGQLTIFSGNNWHIVIDPNTSVTVTQTDPLTAGAATLDGILFLL